MKNLKFALSIALILGSTAAMAQEVGQKLSGAPVDTSTPPSSYEVASLNSFDCDQRCQGIDRALIAYLEGRVQEVVLDDPDACDYLSRAFNAYCTTYKQETPSSKRMQKVMNSKSLIPEDIAQAN